MAAPAFEQGTLDSLHEAKRELELAISAYEATEFETEPAEKVSLLGHFIHHCREAIKEINDAKTIALKY